MTSNEENMMGNVFMGPKNFAFMPKDNNINLHPGDKIIKIVFVRREILISFNRNYSNKFGGNNNLTLMDELFHF